MKINKKVNIPCTAKQFFYNWYIFTKPFHNLNESSIDVLAQLAYYYNEYKKDVLKEDLVWKLVFDYDTKMNIKEYLNITDDVFQNRLSVLRKEKAIINNTIPLKFLPILENNNYTLTFNFQINE